MTTLTSRRIQNKINVQEIGNTFIYSSITKFEYKRGKYRERATAPCQKDSYKNKLLKPRY